MGWVSGSGAGRTPNGGRGMNCGDGVPGQLPSRTLARRVTIGETLVTREPDARVPDPMDLGTVEEVRAALAAVKAASGLSLTRIVDRSRDLLDSVEDARSRGTGDRWC